MSLKTQDLRDSQFALSVMGRERNRVNFKCEYKGRSVTFHGYTKLSLWERIKNVFIDKYEKFQLNHRTVYINTHTYENATKASPAEYAVQGMVRSHLFVGRNDLGTHIQKCQIKLRALDAYDRAAVELQSVKQGNEENKSDLIKTNAMLKLRALGTYWGFSGEGLSDLVEQISTETYDADAIDDIQDLSTLTSLSLKLELLEEYFEDTENSASAEIVDQLHTKVADRMDAVLGRPNR